MTAAKRLRDRALELRLIAASRLNDFDARQTRDAADELSAIADALDAGGAVVNDYVVVPLGESEVRSVPIPPPEAQTVGGKHRRPAVAEAVQ